MTGSWFMKEGAPREDLMSRRLLIGTWHSESTDVHAVKRIEDAFRFANGTYTIHFVELSEAGKVTLDQTECGRWGISGDVYFTITTAVRAGNKGEQVSPYDATYYDAYRVLSLTTTAFEYKSVTTGEIDLESRVSDMASAPDLQGSGSSAVSPCEGTST
jgi:hypothetical protein